MSVEIRCDKCGEITPSSLIWKFIPEPSKELQSAGYGKEHSDMCHECKKKWFNSNVYATFRKQIIRD